MGHPVPHHGYSYGQYLLLEETSNVRHEYFDGEIYAMAGGTPTHAALAAAVTGSLHAQLRGGPCRVYSSDLRVRIRTTGLATYPDVTVVCGPIEPDPESRHTVTNPRLVVEVTSEGTETYDRTEKLEHYKNVESLAAIVLVSHSEIRLDLWLRGGDGGWALSSFGPGEVLDLTSIGCRLEVDEIYRDLAIP